MTDFYVSYTAADQAWAEWIAWQLETAGFTTGLQAWDFRPGSDFLHEMRQATTQADRTIAVLSPAYFGSKFGEAEWRVAFAEDPTGEGGRLVPVRVEECDPPGLLAARVYIDLVGLDEVTARERLLAGVREGKRPGRPDVAPAFPGGGPRPSRTTGPDFPSSPRRRRKAVPRFPGTFRQQVEWLSDAPAATDLLRRRPLAQALATHLRRMHDEEPTTSFLIHIDGPWGTGKSTLLKFLRTELEPDWLIVDFDAWRQARVGPPWWALLASLRHNLGRNLGLLAAHGFGLPSRRLVYAAQALRLSWP